MELLFGFLIVMVPFSMSLILHCGQMDELSTGAGGNSPLRSYFYRGLIKPCLVAVVVFVVVPSLFVSSTIYAAVSVLLFFVAAITGCLLSWLMVGTYWYAKTVRRSERNSPLP